jgi:hypothetical protein
VVQRSHLISSFQIYEDAVTKQIRCDYIPFVYGILTGYLYEQGVTLEHEPLASSFSLYRPLRKSCYSIIVGDSASVTEKCIASSLAVEIVACEEFKIKAKTVKLQGLLNNKKGSLRWATFVKCAQVTFNTTLARQLPQQYLGLCCILNYWWHSPLIHLAQWELNALLAQAVSQYAADVASLKRVLVSVVNTRAINLALQLARGAEVLLQIASVTCLSPEPFLLHNYFDGKLFSFYYYLSDKGATIEKLCDDLPDRIEMFKFLMMVVQSKNLSIDEEEEEESDEEDEKKETVNVSIVPEYEAISDDDEDKVEVEPVTDDELFDDAVTGPPQDISADCKTDSVQDQPNTEAGAEFQQDTIELGASDPKESLEIRSKLDRKDSTNGTVDEMMKLQMTSPDPEIRPRFPSFPSVTEADKVKEEKAPETEPAKPQENSHPVSKQLFPINGSGPPRKPIFRPNNGHDACGPPEPAPPGLEPVTADLKLQKMETLDQELRAPEQDFKPRIPLPPLPDPMPLYSDPLYGKGGGGFSSYSPHPVRYKRHSDKENYGSNQPGRQPMYSVVGPQGVLSSGTANPVKRHKSEES